MRRWSFPLILFPLCACGPETGIPQPDPIPFATSIRTTGAESDVTPESVDVVGLPGAVVGPGRVTVQSRSRQVTVEASASGSFFAAVTALAGELLQVRYEASEPVQVRVLVTTDSMIQVGPDP